MSLIQIPTDQTCSVYVFKIGSDYIARTRDGKILSSGTNATTVIQAGLNGLTAGRTWKEVIKLQGNFTAITHLTVASFVTLDLIDAKLAQANSANTQLIINSDTTNGNTDIEIIGGEIDGNKAGQSAGGATEEERSMVVFIKCSNITVRNSTLRNGNFHNLYFMDCPRYCTAINNRSFDARREHISAHARNSAKGSCRNYLFSGNIIENVAAGNTAIVTLNIADAIIENNSCEKMFDNTSGITPNGLRNIVKGNTIRNAGTAAIIAGQGGGAPDPSLYDTSDSIISKNIIINPVGFGIYLDSFAGRNIVVSDNVVVGAGNNGVTTHAGIVVTPGLQDIVVDNNIVHDCGGNGILVYSWFDLLASNITKNVRVSNNLCYNNGKALQALPSDNRAGITITDAGNDIGNISNITVENNRSYDGQGTQTQAYGVKLNFTKDCTVQNNDLRGNLTKALELTTNASPTFLNNIGDVQEAGSFNFRGRKKYGYYINTVQPAVVFTQGLAFNLGASEGTAVGQNDPVTVKDRWNRFDTGATSGNRAGMKLTLAITASRALNLRWYGRFRLVGITAATRAFIGLMSTTTDIASDDPLNALHGIGIGFRSTDTNWQIISNDGGGAGLSAFTALTPTLAKTNADLHMIEIKAVEAYPRFEVRLDDNAPQLITTDIPANNQNLGVYEKIQTTEAVNKSIDPFWWEIEVDRV